MFRTYWQWRLDSVNARILMNIRLQITLVGLRTWDNPPAEIRPELAKIEQEAKHTLIQLRRQQAYYRSRLGQKEAPIMEDHIHTALIALQDRVAALEGAQPETERRLAALERIARLAHTERQTYRAWQTTNADGWLAYKAARAALDGALVALGSGATLTFSYLEPESDQDQGHYQGAGDSWGVTHDPTK